jgi:hypothetical protein
MRGLKTEGAILLTEIGMESRAVARLVSFQETDRDKQEDKNRGGEYEQGRECNLVRTELVGRTQRRPRDDREDVHSIHNRFTKVSCSSCTNKCRDPSGECDSLAAVMQYRRCRGLVLVLSEYKNNDHGRCCRGRRCR